MNEPNETSQKMPPWVRRAIFTWWGVLAVLWLALGVIRQLDSLLTQLALALFFSFAMEPVVDRLGQRGVKRGLATALTMGAVFLFLILFLTAMGSLISSQVQQLAVDLPGYATSAELWIENQFDLELDSADLVDQLQAGGRLNDYLSRFADDLVNAGTTLLSVLFQLLTISLFAFYFTADGPRLRQSICSILPPARQIEVLRVWELAINKTGAFISSRVILAIVSAGFHWIVFALLGLPSALALALWVGIISQFIPVIGIYIAGIVPALIALGIDPTKALWVTIAMVIYQQVENYGLQPRITAQTLNMHPAVAFGGVLAGSAMFGATGAVLALPLVATVQSFISAYVARHTVVESYLVPSARTAAYGDSADPVATGVDADIESQAETGAEMTVEAGTEPAVEAGKTSTEPEVDTP